MVDMLEGQYDDGWDVSRRIQDTYPRVITDVEKEYGGWFKLRGGVLWLVYESREVASVHIHGRNLLGWELNDVVDYLADEVGVEIVARAPLPRVLELWLSRQMCWFEQNGDYWYGRRS
jgi:hypothetical protein